MGGEGTRERTWEKERGRGRGGGGEREEGEGERGRERGGEDMAHASANCLGKGAPGLLSHHEEKKQQVGQKHSKSKSRWTLI